MDFFNWNHGSDLFFFKSSGREQTHRARGTVKSHTSRWAGRSTSVLTWEGVLFRRQNDLITLLALLILEKNRKEQNEQDRYQKRRGADGQSRAVYQEGAQKAPRETTWWGIPPWRLPQPHFTAGAHVPSETCRQRAGRARAPIPSWGLDYFLPCVNLGRGDQAIRAIPTNITDSPPNKSAVFIFASLQGWPLDAMSGPGAL